MMTFIVRSLCLLVDACANSRFALLRGTDAEPLLNLDDGYRGMKLSGVPGVGQGIEINLPVEDSVT